MRRNEVRLEIQYDGTWHDLAADDKVLAAAPLRISRGDTAEVAAPRPASVAARLDNRDDMLRPANPESPLYGKAGLNTPMRVAVHDVIRGQVQASTWKTDESPSFRAGKGTGSAHVDVDGGGLLQQIGQWKEPLKSPITRHALGLSSLIGLWPLDDVRDATSLSTLLPGGFPGTFSGDVTLGSDVRPGGATATVLIGPGGSLAGRMQTAPTAAGYQITFAVRIGATVTATPLELFRWTDSTGRRWTWEVSATDWLWNVTAPDGTSLSFTAAGHGGTLTDWRRCRMKVSVVGANVQYEPAWYREGESSVFGSTFSFAGTVAGQVQEWRVPATTYTDGANFSSIYAVDDPAVDLVNSAGAITSFTGHRGERARDRFGRLMNELGLAWNSIGTTALSQRMGVQPAAPLMEILKEIRDTEDGLMFDDIDGVRVLFMLRNARLNQTPVTIDVAELPARPREVTDDLGVFNIVTVSQRNGGEASAEDSTGPVGSAIAPTGVGPYEKTIDVNVYDEADLPALAQYWLNRGTVEDPRYPAVTVNLAAMHPSRVAEIEALDVGSVLEITGYRADPIRLQVVGYTETIGWPNARSITFTCVPDRQFLVAVYEESRYNLATATMAAAAGPGVATLTIALTADEAWSSTSAYTLKIAGETIDIPAGAMGARTGTLGAYTQTATGVLRSRNGIRKTLPAGAAVKLDNPGRWTR